MTIIVIIIKLLMKVFIILIAVEYLSYGQCRDEDKIMQACYWSHEIYEPCFGGCAEVSCDNPRNHLRPCYPYCEPGCICEEPYVRDDRTHQCVLPQDCSPTQMGIPVPSKRVGKANAPRYMNSRSPNKHQDGIEFSENDRSLSHSKHQDAIEFNENDRPNNIRREESKRDQGVSRMGNYFNIVIAPPPIKALQPRKMLLNDGFGISAKRI